MIRKLYTITRDAILGLAELPALHSLAQEATDDKVSDKAQAIADEAIDKHDESFREFLNEMTLGEIKLKEQVARLTGELQVEYAVFCDVKEFAHIRISGQEQHIKEVEAALERVKKERDELKSAINRDRTGLGLGLAAVRRIASGYSWIANGEWASYDYTQQSEATLRREVGFLIGSIENAALSALKTSGDLADAAINRRLENCESIESLAKERNELKAKLARHVEAERWRQVTARAVELPPANIKIIYKLSPSGPLFIGWPYPKYATFEWRYASSEDVPR
jgi:hypothetical protein